MERAYIEKTYTSKDNEAIGSVKIADDVVAMIAGLAAMEVDGVSAMAGNISKELMSKVGVRNLAKGVKVEILGKRVIVDMAIIVNYGYNIPAISQKIQLKVRAAIENMTGLNVTDVNLRIAGVNNII
ncbi:MAG: Asp23/Gls24 family envelope stress response protein [Lachnospiraceae bacterium]|nr:Asp23/Gls24 family envelope stress response protein [Lachnospiraceae bacterium]